MPRWHRNGRVYAADDVYRIVMHGDDTHHIPEQRRRLQFAAEAEAAGYAVAAAKIDAIKHRFTS